MGTTVTSSTNVGNCTHRDTTFDDANDCCARHSRDESNPEGQPVIKNENECGCAPIDALMIKKGSIADDCCSGAMNEEKRCIKKECILKGQPASDGECCTSSSDNRTY